MPCPGAPTWLPRTGMHSRVTELSSPGPSPELTVLPCPVRKRRPQPPVGVCQRPGPAPLNSGRRVASASSVFLTFSCSAGAGGKHPCSVAERGAETQLPDSSSSEKSALSNLSVAFYSAHLPRCQGWPVRASASRHVDTLGSTSLEHVGVPETAVLDLRDPREIRSASVNILLYKLQNQVLVRYLWAHLRTCGCKTH